jgi:CPA2 family monovalent cation:H+ antiporter-2
VITYASTPSALKVLHHMHDLAPHLPVIVRSHDDSDLDKLRAAGATEVVPEAMEGSLMLASHAMLTLGVPLRRVVHRVQAARSERYATLRGFFHGSSDVSDATDSEQVRLHSVPLGESCKVVGKTLAEADLKDFGVEVTAVRRGKERLTVSPELTLMAGDTIVLRGGAEELARAETRLLKS